MRWRTYVHSPEALVVTASELSSYQLALARLYQARLKGRESAALLDFSFVLEKPQLAATGETQGNRGKPGTPYAIRRASVVVLTGRPNEPRVARLANGSSAQGVNGDQEIKDTMGSSMPTTPRRGRSQSQGCWSAQVSWHGIAYGVPRAPQISSSRRTTPTR